MNAFVLFPLQESNAQGSAGKHDQWRGYMTVLDVNHRIIKSFTIITVVIRPVIKFDVDKLWDGFRQEVKWMLGIC